MSNRHNTPRKMRGVTLIELMLVVVIVAILAAFAVPAYRNYVQRSQRVDATSALLRLAAAQERFYLQNNIYATEAQRAPAPPAGLGLAATENDWYDLQIMGADAIQFSAQATPKAGSPQVTDGACQTFTIDSAGVRTSAPDPVNVCWR